jgi:hypothetical protein
MKDASVVTQVASLSEHIRTGGEPEGMVRNQAPHDVTGERGCDCGLRLIGFGKHLRAAIKVQLNAVSPPTKHSNHSRTRGFFRCTSQSLKEIAPQIFRACRSTCPEAFHRFGRILSVYGVLAHNLF